MKRPFDQLMAEHIHLPGVPQIVVTRQFAYQWLIKMGHNPSERGFGSLDYIVFAAKETAEPLADLEEWKPLLAVVEADLQEVK